MRLILKIKVKDGINHFYFPLPFWFLSKKASKDIEYRTGQRIFDSQSNEIRDLPCNDEIHHGLSLNQ